MGKPKMYGMQTKPNLRPRVDVRYQRQQRQRENTMRKPVASNLITKGKETGK